jgi:predicted acyltransferase
MVEVRPSLPEPAPEIALAAKSPRLVSLDALRGFDMLWIIGLDQFFRAGARNFDAPWLKWMGSQMVHRDWLGSTLYDLVFPLFMVISGVTIPLALLSKLERGVSKRSLHFAAFRRMVLLILLGIVYNGGLALTGWSSTHYASVLGNIGIAYFFAAVIALNCRPRWQIFWLLAILLGYWAALEWIPVPGVGAGVFTPEKNLAAWIDQHYLPGTLHLPLNSRLKTHDAEGILPTVSGIATVLIGVLAGHWLRKPDRRPWIKVWGLLGGGAACLGIGLLWGQFFPIIKVLRTGSFVLWSSGASLMLLGLFYAIIDVMGWKKWAFPFVVVGMNSITIYMASKMVNFGYTANFLFAGMIKLAPKEYAPLLNYAAIMAIEWLFLFFLYRKKIFLRI